MRYRPEHKVEIHHKIVKDASRRVRAEGLNGAAVSAVMRDAGLTHGDFTSTSRARKICSSNRLAKLSGKSPIPWFMPLNSRLGLRGRLS